MLRIFAVPTPVRNNQQPVIISVTIVVVAAAIATCITIVLIIIFYTKHCQTKQHNEDKDKLCLAEIKSEPDGLLEVDEDMFAAHGPDRFVPTMVKKYEGMATDEQVDKTPDLEEPQKNANVKPTTVASLMEKFQNPQVL